MSHIYHKAEPELPEQNIWAEVGSQTTLIMESTLIYFCFLASWNVFETPLPLSIIQLIQQALGDIPLHSQAPVSIEGKEETFRELEFFPIR